MIGFWRYPTDIKSRYIREEPVKGTQALAQLDRQLRVFTTYSTGSFVLFAAHGNARVFVDSRADVYGDRILNQAYRAMYGRDWEKTFDDWQIDSAVVDRINPIASRLTEPPDWNLLAEDKSSLTFVKTALQ